MKRQKVPGSSSSINTYWLVKLEASQLSGLWLPFLGAEMRICAGCGCGSVAGCACQCKAWHPNRNKAHAVARTATVVALCTQNVTHMEHLSLLPIYLDSNIHTLLLIPQYIHIQNSRQLGLQGTICMSFS